MKFIYALLLLAITPACATINKPFLYSAEKDDKEIILFGTIHKGVAARELPSIVEKKMDGASVAFFEISIAEFEDMLAEDEAKIKYNRERKYLRRLKSMHEDEEPILSQRISKQAFAKLKESLPQFSEEVLNELNPRGALGWINDQDMVMVSRYEYNRLNPWNTMDYVLAQTARDKKIKMVSLDKDIEICRTEFSIAAAKELEDWANGQSLLSNEQGIEKLRIMVDFYRAGDELGLASASNEANPIELECVLNKRNTLWEGMIGNYLTKGEKAFVAVGAMHLLPGKYPSLLDHLKNRGYKIARLAP